MFESLYIVAMKSICVFCGSSPGNDPMFLQTAQELGRALAESQITLVYGGAKVGLMGTVADAVLKHRGTVIGVLPKLLAEKELAHQGLTKLILCESMHERKTIMFEHSEGFIALPGGFGTLEEVIEILTWRQLGIHKHPVGFLNVNGFYNHLRSFFDEAERCELLRSDIKNMALFDVEPTGLLQQMSSYVAPAVTKWISKSST